ncbi:FtsK/SpoIIIE domain-containing protein [Streptomyces sp. NPDC002746]
MSALISADDVVQYLPLVAVTSGSALGVLAVLWLVRYLMADAAHRASIRQAVRIRLRWKRLAPMLKLAATDRTPTAMDSLSTTDGKPPKPRTLVPPLKVRHDAYGVIARAGCLPGVGLEEYQKAAPYLADAWRCTRVAVTQDTPSHVLIRGVRLDPLTTATRHHPTGRAPEVAARWDLGVDEYAQPVTVDLTQVPGVTVAGLPGSGKTSLINRLMSDWAPSPAVQFACADGKVTTAYEGDYAHLANRMFAFVGDDLEAANVLFRRLVKLRRDRVAAAPSMLGGPDMWQVGPSESWPLVVLIVDEAHTYFRDHKGSDKETKRLAALAAENARLVEDLVKKGRAMGILVVLATQKSTGDAIPTFIRDVCPVGLSFAQKTSDAAVAALGEDIRNWPDADPVNLQGRSYVGVAAMNHPTQPGFLRIRTPLVTSDDSAEIAHRTAHLTQDPATLLPRIPPRIGLGKAAPDEQSGPLAA